MSLYKRKGSPFWQSEIQVGGRRFYRSTGTASRREAESVERRFKEEARQEAKRGPRTASVNLTVDQMFGRYWIEHGSKLRWSANVAAYGKRIVATLGFIPLAEMNQADCASLIDGLRAEGMGAVSINRAIAVFRAAHTMAGKRWGCAVNPIDWRAFRTKEARERVRWITHDEARTLLALLPPHIALIAEWSLYTGLRKRETLTLDWDSVNLDQGWVEVTAKGGERRRLVLSKQAKSCIDRAARNGRLVFDGTNLRKHFVRAVRKAGLKDFHFHDLRHTHATWLRQSGAPLEVVRRALGHSSVAVTEKYAHVDDKEVVAATEAIDNLMPANVIPFERERKAQFTYFITDGEAVKIGRSSDPERRLQVIQTGHPKRVRLLGTVAAEQMSEFEAHARFAELHKRGEWFVCDDAIRDAIEGLCRDMKLRNVGADRARKSEK